MGEKGAYPGRGALRLRSERAASNFIRNVELFALARCVCFRGTEESFVQFILFFLEVCLSNAGGGGRCGVRERRLSSLSGSRC